MSDISDDQKELIKIGAEAAFKPFAELTQKLFGGACEQIGGYWEDGLKFRRQLRQLKLLKKLDIAIEDAGFTPRAIPDAIWIDAVEEASRVDDETLRDKWAAMLVNAADPSQDRPIAVSFISILKELSPNDAKFLDSLFDRYKANGTSSLDYFQLMTAGGNARLSGDQWSVCLDVLKRNGVIEEKISPSDIAIPEGSPVTEYHPYLYWRLTAIGIAFVRACRPPIPSTPTDVSA